MLKQIDPNFVFYIITEPMEEEEAAPAKAETPAKAPVASPKKEVASPKKEVASPKKEVTKEGETPKAEDATKEGETPKGQFISECLNDFLKFSKKPTKNLTNFGPRI